MVMKKGEIPGVTCYEAGHPVPDENGFMATEKVLSLVDKLDEQDTVLFLLSGGGSALFEAPLILGEELQDITRQLLSSGADINSMNTVRKGKRRYSGNRRFSVWLMYKKEEKTMPFIDSKVSVKISEEQEVKVWGYLARKNVVYVVIRWAH